MDRFEFDEATIAGLQERMATGGLTATALLGAYLDRIAAVDRDGPRLGAVLELNPDAERIAAELDAERQRRGPRGPLHGIPVLLKDSIDTADRQHTTAGSLALYQSRPRRDATVAERLRAAGAVLIGKANMSEWANFRSIHSSSGWSARGGQCRNPYALDRSPSGSSSGSAVAAAANLSTVAIGTETDGSILSPSSVCGVVGIKPTVGLTSRAGVIPISHHQDTVGPICRTVADAATVLGALAGPDPRDPATTAATAGGDHDYRAFLDPDGLRGARIGIARDTYFGFNGASDAIAEAAIEVLAGAGAEVIDPADIPTAKRIADSSAELEVLQFEFKHNFTNYLAQRGDPEIRTIADLIAFNLRNATTELPWFGQDLFEAAEEKGPLTDPAYLEALERGRRLAREEGIDAVMAAHRLDALFMPTDSPAWKIDLLCGDHFLGSCSQPAALAGYPAVTVPAGATFGMPVGATFMGGAFSEPTLIRLAYAFERATAARRPPPFHPGGVVPEA